MPWKNGGGETFEILISPVDASFDDLEWRVSMARVSSDGPFSSLPGLDRTLTVLSGDALTLSDNEGSVRLTTKSAPFSFVGERNLVGKVEGRTVMDLNVMTRRGRARHTVRRGHLSGRTVLEADDQALSMIFLLEPGLRVSGQRLEKHDSVVVAVDGLPLEVVADDLINILVVDIYSLPV